MNWRCVPFDQLTVQELHDLLQLRARVFVVEQDCVYLDIDGRDPGAIHVLGHDDDVLVATARLLAPDGDAASIGRVVVAPEARGRSLGRELMQQAITATVARWPGPIQLSAQSYLLEFYRSLGFQPVGEGYLEDGIPHQGMRRPA